MHLASETCLSVVQKYQCFVQNHNNTYISSLNNFIKTENLEERQYNYLTPRSRRFFEISDIEIKKRLDCMVASLISYRKFFERSDAKETSALNVGMSEALNVFINTEEDLLQFLNTYTSSVQNLGISFIKFLNQEDIHGIYLVHYATALNYLEVIKILNNLDHSLLSALTKWEKLSVFDIAAGKWSSSTLFYLMSNNSIKDAQTINQGLMIAFDTSSFIKSKDLEVIYLLLRHLKIEFTIGDTSEQILKTLEYEGHPQVYSEKELSYDSNYVIKNRDKYIETLQTHMRSWLTRNKYKDLKKSTMKLQSKLKNATITIQKAYRSYLKKR